MTVRCARVRVSECLMRDLGVCGDATLSPLGTGPGSHCCSALQGTPLHPPRVRRDGAETKIVQPIAALKPRELRKAGVATRHVMSWQARQVA